MIDENGNHSYPSDGPTMRVEEGNIKELEISLDSFEEAWLIFAVRDNLDVNNVELNLTLNGINLAPSTSAFENITAVGINSTWSEEIIDNDSINVVINVFEGERQFVRDNNKLGTFDLQGIPPMPRGVPQIEITYDVDANGILNVKAIDKGTNKEQKIKVEASSGLSDKEIEDMVQDAESKSEEDEKKKEVINQRNNLDQLIYSTEKTLNDNADKITDIAPLNQIKVLAYKEKGEWILETKYNIGKKKKVEEPA